MKVDFIKGDNGVIYVNGTEMFAYEDGFIDGMKFARRCPDASIDVVTETLGAMGNYIAERWQKQKERGVKDE